MNQNLSDINVNETRDAAISVTEENDVSFPRTCLGLEDLEEEQRDRESVRAASGGR